MWILYLLLVAAFYFGSRLGYRDGHDDGYEAGYRTGWSIGYDDGYGTAKERSIIFDDRRADDSPDRPRINGRWIKDRRAVPMKG